MSLVFAGGARVCAVRLRGPCGVGAGGGGVNSTRRGSLKIILIVSDNKELLAIKIHVNHNEGRFITIYFNPFTYKNSKS